MTEKYVEGYGKLVREFFGGATKADADNFIKFTPLCPSGFGLDDPSTVQCLSGKCADCWRKALEELEEEQ